MTAFYSVKESQGRLGDSAAGGNEEPEAVPDGGAALPKVTPEVKGAAGKSDGARGAGRAGGGVAGFVGKAEGAGGNANTNLDVTNDAEFYKAAVLHAGIPVVPLDLSGCI